MNIDNIDIKKIVDDIGIQNVAVAAIAVFVLGLIVLSFTFILPILTFAAAIGIIGFLVFLVYKIIGGK